MATFHRQKCFYFQRKKMGALGIWEVIMAKVIEFYVPKNFHRNTPVTSEKPGRLIEFCLPKKSA
jgi:hypothetical protein